MDVRSADIKKRIVDVERRQNELRFTIYKSTEMWLQDHITRDHLESLEITIRNQKEKMIQLDKEKEVLESVEFYLSLRETD